jgi:hypothetical protein
MRSLSEAVLCLLRVCNLSDERAENELNTHRAVEQTAQGALPVRDFWEDFAQI